MTAPARFLALSFPLLLASTALACSSTAGSGTDPRDGGDGDANLREDAGVLDDAGSSSDAGEVVAEGGDASKAATCAAAFGTALTAPYGRLDGTVLAVVEPGNPTCAKPNGSHVVLQVTMGGQAYRMVVNVVSDRAGDKDVRYLAMQHGLPNPAWSEGWHTDATLDYPGTLGVHSTAGFKPVVMDDLVARVVSAINVGGHVSVYATTSGGDSAHLVHRNATGQDGAIVLEADGPAPTWLLFHFVQQTF